MGLGVGRGLVNLFKKWGTGIGNAADNIWLRADAQKAIREAVEKKYKPRIDRANKSESVRAKNIKDLDEKVRKSKEDLQNAQKEWQDKYNDALADAKSQRQKAIDDYKQQLQIYQDAKDAAKADKQSILDELSDSEARYDRSRTIFADVNTGERYIFNPITGKYDSLTQIYNQLGKKSNESLKRRYKVMKLDYLINNQIK